MVRRVNGLMHHWRNNCGRGCSGRHTAAPVFCVPELKLVIRRAGRHKRLRRSWPEWLIQINSPPNWTRLPAWLDSHSEWSLQPGLEYVGVE